VVAGVVCNIVLVLVWIVYYSLFNFVFFNQMFYVTKKAVCCKL